MAALKFNGADVFGAGRTVDFSYFKNVPVRLTDVAVSYANCGNFLTVKRTQSGTVVTLALRNYSTQCNCNCNCNS